MEDSEAARWEAALGGNAKHYLKSFERIRSAGGRWAINWNSAAFLHSSAWFCYRRMYLWSALNFIAPAAVMIALVLLGTGDTALLAAIAAYLVCVFVLLPVFADAIYFRHLGGALERAKAPSAWTGLAAFGVVLLYMLLFAAVAMPSYGDYTPRAKVSEAILAASRMRTEVTEFFHQHGRLPSAGDAAKLDQTANSKYVESISYDALRSTIVVKLRQPFEGKHLELKALMESGKLAGWRCGSPDLDRRALPGSCRD